MNGDIETLVGRYVHVDIDGEMYRIFTTYMRTFGGTRPFLVACGPNGNDMRWSRGLLQTIGTGRTRLLGVAGATLAAVAVWMIEVPLLGIHLLTRFGNAAPQTVGIDAPHHTAGQRATLLLEIPERD